MLYTAQYRSVEDFYKLKPLNKNKKNIVSRVFLIENICTFLEKGMKTETAISSGFRMVFPKLTKKSWLRGTSRLPPGGLRQNCILIRSVKKKTKLSLTGIKVCTSTKAVETYRLKWPSLCSSRQPRQGSGLSLGMHSWCCLQETNDAEINYKFTQFPLQGLIYLLVNLWQTILQLTVTKIKRAITFTKIVVFNHEAFLYIKFCN